MSTEIWKLLIWKRAEPIYKNFDEQISSASKLDWEIKSAETSISRLIEDFEAIEQICNECGQTIPNIEVHREKKKQEIDLLKKKLKTLKSGQKIDADDLTIRVGRLLELKPERGDLERLMDAENLWKEN